MREECPGMCKSPVAGGKWRVYEAERRTLCLEPIKEDGSMVHTDTGEAVGARIQITTGRVKLHCFDPLSSEKPSKGLT